MAFSDFQKELTSGKTFEVGDSRHCNSWNRCQSSEGKSR